MTAPSSTLEEPIRYWAYEEGQPIIKQGRRPADYYLKVHARDPRAALLEEIRERVKA